MRTLFAAFRVYQYPKNLVVFAALVFAQEFTHLALFLRTIAAFVILCAAASSVYILNDLRDVEKDRNHPEKRHRPFASGALSMSTGLGLYFALLLGSLAAGFALAPKFGWAIAVYLIVNVLYTMGLKNVVLIDVMLVAFGFVIRAVAGAMAIEVSFSNWLAVCTLFLALFLVLGKRRRELMALEQAAADHREVLSHYSVPFLDALILIMASATLIVYVIYTCTPEVIARLGTDKLYFTVPFVVYGLFRYLYLVHHRGGGGDPSRTLLTDRPILVTVLAWGLVSMGILYVTGAAGGGVPQ